MNATNVNYAIFGGGCFWCIEAVLQRINGVLTVESGYANGHAKEPNYRDVCKGDSGYAEVVKVGYDPEIISYEDLLLIFMTSHDPTSLNQQGADRGTQYRSGIYYENDAQKETAELVVKELTAHYSSTIVTEIEPLRNYFVAEEYHQNYYNQNSSAGYCRVVIEPKINKLRAMFSDKLKKAV